MLAVTCGSAEHALARGRSCGWESTAGPVTPDGIYQIVAKAGNKAGVAVYPHRFRHHFSSLPVFWTAEVPGETSWS